MSDHITPPTTDDQTVQRHTELSDLSPLVEFTGRLVEEADFGLTQDAEVRADVAAAGARGVTYEQYTDDRDAAEMWAGMSPFEKLLADHERRGAEDQRNTEDGWW